MHARSSKAGKFVNQLAKIMRPVYTQPMERGWAGLPYHPISKHYQRLFGTKVYKIPVSVVDDCPNRMGLKGMQTCIFCDEWGSAAKAESLNLPLSEQIEKYKDSISQKFKAQNFLVYFQAYTNTFTKISALRANFETALRHPGVVGIVIGTRPDCLSKAVLDLWREYSLRTHVAVEIGVQSFFDDQLTFLRRGHTADQAIEAIHRISEETSVDLGIHLIFGQPGETDEQIVQTAQIVNSLPITNVKLHNLHVLKNTPLEELYLRGEFSPIDFITYSQRVAIFLDHLSPALAIHRLAAFSSRWDELVAPEWTSDKMKTHQGIVEYLREKGHWQSRLFQTGDPLLIQLRKDLAVQSAPVTNFQQFKTL
ncbi:MAG: TIGR01212 family radical SAM protein [Bdellovibrionaceae bacterium]|nr:TIGR01212 family radical SAM protein [Pseudobdellovibrionaceae bacterium]